MRRATVRLLLLLALAPALAGAAGPGDGARVGEEPWARAGAQVAGEARAGDGAAADEPGSELRVWLLTMGPGEAIWERFGHNALRVVDTRTGYDASYNWGIFDFRQEDFIPRFLRGRMLYMMAPFDSEAMIAAYRAAGREIVAQELALTPAQKLELQTLAERNARPENRDYFYDYFLDNCSTRVRDLLDHVLDGALQEAFADAPTGRTYRWHTRRLTQPDPLLFTGMDILLGTPGDRPITRWEEMFVPMSLRDAVRELEVPAPDGGFRPLVISEEVLAPARVASEPGAPPGWLGRYLLLGVVLGAAFLLLGRAGVGAPVARTAFGVVSGVWGALAGLAGLILVLVLFTDHRFMFWNENLFLLNPVALPMAVVGPLAAARASSRVVLARLAAIVAALAVVGLVVGLTPFAEQTNGLETALLLPVHLGLWGGAEALRRGGARMGAGEGRARS